MTLTPSDVQALVTAFIATGTYSNDLLYKIQLSNEREAETQRVLGERCKGLEEGTSSLIRKRDGLEVMCRTLNNYIARLTGLLQSLSPTMSAEQWASVQEAISDKP